MYIGEIFTAIDKLASRKALLLWLIFLGISFALYFPARNAGFVSDTTGWLESIHKSSFTDYINRTGFAVKSLYQVTQFNTWVLYQLFGTNPLLWHIVFVSLHALVCVIILKFFRRLFIDSKLQNGGAIAFIGSLLFCTSPYHTETVVWEASFHFLQALLLMFGTLICVQRYLHRPSQKYVLIGILLFVVATFTHELFYLTPVFTLLIILYYHILGSNRLYISKAINYFVLPLAICFVLHLLLYRLVYNNSVSHISSSIFDKPIGYFLVKVPWYFFHLFLFGRFWPDGVRANVYDLFRTPQGAIIFYGIAFIVLAFIVFKALKTKKAGLMITAYLFLSLLCSLAILMPMWFPEHMFVYCDRYTYLPMVFVAMFMAIALRGSKMAWIICPLLLVQIVLSLQLNFIWGQSAKLIKNVQQSPLLANTGKIKILLNSPASLQGIPMIGATKEGEFKLMHNMVFQPPVTDTMHEVLAYNMVSPKDGAHVEVVDSQTLKVVLNHWGTWWLFGSEVASSYEQRWYRCNIADTGHSYELILKYPIDKYELFYISDGCLKQVDITKTYEQY